MTTTATSPRELARPQGAPAPPRRPRRVERWRWLVAGTVAGALVVIGFGFLVWVWIAALLIVGIHEGGHAIAARRLGIPTPAMVIGVGPTIVRLRPRGMRVEVRAMPVIGWVEIDRDPEQLGSARVAAVYAAGPLASLLLSVVVILGASAWYQGPTNLGPADVRDASDAAVDTAKEMWTTPFEHLFDVIRSWSADPERDDGLTAPDSSSSSANEEKPGGQVVSVVGLTAAAPTQVTTHGISWAFAAVAGVSASVAGLNLLPAWGLDGHRLLEELSWSIDRRNRRWGRRARLSVAAVGAVTAVLVLWLVAGAIVRDVAGLF